MSAELERATMHPWARAGTVQSEATAAASAKTTAVLYIPSMKSTPSRDSWIYVTSARSGGHSGNALEESGSTTARLRSRLCELPNQQGDVEVRRIRGGRGLNRQGQGAGIHSAVVAFRQNGVVRGVLGSNLKAAVGGGIDAAQHGRNAHGLGGFDAVAEHALFAGRDGSGASEEFHDSHRAGNLRFGGRARAASANGIERPHGEQQHRGRNRSCQANRHEYCID